MNTRDLLATLPVFAGCPDDALDALAALAHVGHLETDELLFEEGDPATAAFVIARGSVRITKAVLVDTHRTLAVLREGTFFGEAALIGEFTRSATVIACEPCEMVALPREPMRAWLEAHPALGVRTLTHLGRQMMERLRGTNELLKETVAWGLEVSGASMLSLDRLITQRATMRISLGSGRTVAGRLVRVDVDDERQPRLWVSTLAGETHLIPYHAIEDLVADVDLEALHRIASGAEEG